MFNSAKLPFASVMVCETVSPLEVSTLTVAPEMTALVGSTTEPRIARVFWATAELARPQKHRTMAQSLFIMMEP
jgi:hypothetical protein